MTDAFTGIYEISDGSNNIMIVEVQRASIVNNIYRLDIMTAFNGFSFPPLERFIRELFSSVTKSPHLGQFIPRGNRVSALYVSLDRAIQLPRFQVKKKTE